MEPQRQMLEALGVDGMSSDEGEKVDDGIQYRILTPRWRAPMLTPWLRMFDVIYRHHRLEDSSGDMRGTLPRRRVATSAESSSRKFVPGLPMNAYKTSWLEEQLDIANIVHPAPQAKYTHDPQLVQYVLPPNRTTSPRLTYPQDGHTNVHLVSPVALFYHSKSMEGTVTSIGFLNSEIPVITFFCLL